MQLIRGTDIEQYIEELGRFRIEIFKEYPYLYEGDLEYERCYLSRYLRSSESILAVIHDSQGMVGSCTAIPLKDEDQEFKKPFIEEDINEVFYIGEIIVRPDLRGKGLGTKMLINVMRLIDFSLYKKICLYTVDRETNHPLRPTSYRSPDSLWRKFGFEKNNLIAHYYWKDIGDTIETEKPMNVWIKSTCK